MDDLARWLGQQLDTDAQEIAEPYAEKAWHARDCAIHPDVWGNEGSSCDCPVPARVLREIDAKRRMIVKCERAVDEDSRGVISMADELLRLLALPYADRGGYRAEWAPTE